MARRTNAHKPGPAALSRRGVLSGVVATAAIPALAGAPALVRSGARPDVIVVGAGVFGAWTAWNLQRGGSKVLLLDAWGPAHARSSSGGETRLIRTEYAAEPLYTRWAWESLAEWLELGKRHEEPIFRQTGALYLYPEHTPKIDESTAIQRALGVPIEQVDPRAMTRRWPQIALDGIALGVWQPTMGALMARRSVRLLVEDFVREGGEFRQFAVAPPAGSGKRLAQVTGRGGEALQADRFIFACGPWLPKLFPKEVGARIVATRQDVFYFAPEAGDARFAPGSMPAWVDVSDKDLHYGFPDIETRGFKIALDVHGPEADPDTMDRRVGDAALTNVRAYLARRFPALADRPLSHSEVCQYENTHTGNFLIDRHPALDNVWLAGGGTGHGFKHGPAFGRYLAGLVLGTTAAEPRFALKSHEPHASAAHEENG